MKFIKLILFLVVLGVAYFGFLRDRLLEYPIQTTLTNTDGEALSVRILGRSDRFVKFQKDGGSMAYDYSINKLDQLSKIKLLFLPNKQASMRSGGSGVSSSNLSDLHMQGMQKELDAFMVERRLLDAKMLSKPTAVEKAAVRSEIADLEIEINELKYKMEQHRARSN